MTIIKSVKAHNFKSFAKPTELLFGKDLSCVIGPNGSGKSNVIDSICFVLGRLSAKSMRAEKSANLIYNGGKDGNPAKEASVAITFDNLKRDFPLDSNDIEIKRIVRENGLSKYLINNELRTRQQVLDLLGIAKINPDGHNIILQGDITHVAEMASEDRKQVLEEISGISLYEDKKQKALSELEKVELKLQQASIVLTERETYLRELKRDRDLALKYKELEKNITRNKATYLHIQINGKKEKIEELVKKIEQTKEKINKINSDIQNLKSQINSKREQVSEINNEIQQKSEQKQLSIQDEISQLKDSLSYNSARIESLKNEINRIKERKEQLKFSIQETEKRDLSLEKQKSELEKQLSLLRKEKEGIEKQVSKLSLSKLSKEIEEKIDKYIDEDSSLAIQLSNARSKHSKFIEQLAVLKAKQASMREINSTNSAIERLKQFKGVYGTIAELGKTEPRFSLALETAAGSRINAVIVEDDEIASKCIEYLKKNKLGTAIFLPLNKIKANVENKKIGYGLAIELIRFNPKFKKAFEYVFGSTFVIDSIQEARKIGIGKGRMVTLDGDLIEIAGAMIGGYRRRKELFKDYTSEISQCEDELLRLEKAVNILEEKRTENDSIITNLRKQLVSQPKNKELSALESEKQLISEKIITINSDIKNINIQINEIFASEKENTSRIIKQHNLELEEFKKEIEDLGKITSEQRVELKKKEKMAKEYSFKYRNFFVKKDKINSEIQKIELSVNDLENKITIFEERINTLSLDKAKLVSELSGLEQEFEPYKNEQLRKGVEFSQLKEEIFKFESMLKNMGNVNLRALEIYEDVYKEYQNLQTKLEKLKSEKLDVLKMIDEIESKKTFAFMKTFDAISVNFERIFSKLTTKGTAHLVLENQEKPLEEGIRILVKISTNKYLDIKSLSGGEKTLTALAFIFAIQEYDPASFYILDEVDAALDKKNSEMLAKLLEEYSKKAQYILISHNDAIISVASHLYGVSMRENGVSNVVSLKV